MSVLFRPQRSTLAEAMVELATVETRADIEKIVGYKVTAIKPYGFDPRIGWHSHIVIVDGGWVAGFTDGDLPS